MDISLLFSLYVLAAVILVVHFSVWNNNVGILYQFDIQDVIDIRRFSFTSVYVTKMTVIGCRYTYLIFPTDIEDCL